MRIRLNGPSQIEDIAAIKYTIKRIDAGSIKTNDPNQIRKKIKYMKVNEDDKIKKQQKSS